ncbi:MAG: D-alanyl-D-alanine carboxypeptidase/D-alanyl-D-alanine-endopeptidase [Bacteroidales bacterium]|nr:D-alanyl-D-alanine carboxypeptidase/D-alanyl-D-alanine-endopeptidase [Bacteroidales bacterium]
MATLCLALFNSCSNAIEKNKPADARYPDYLIEFLAEESLSSASVGILLADAKSGEIIIGHNSGKSLVPASVQKLFVAAAALETFGPDYTFKTELVLDGKMDNKGIFTGNVILMGGGDPALGSERYDEHYQNLIGRFAEALQKQGIKKIEGQIIGDASFFGEILLPSTWLWEDIGNYFGAAATGLNIYENTFRLGLNSGQPGSLTKIVNINPEIPGLTFENNVTASSENRDDAWIFGSYLSSRREIRGTIPAGRSNFIIKGAIPDAALLAAFQLTQKLEKSGVRVSGEPKSSYQKAWYKNPETILTIESPPLSEIVYYLNMNSINLYAETLLLHLSKTTTGETSCEKGCEALQGFWKSKGMDINGFFLKDGSGLSRANAITASQLAFLLRYMKNESRFTGEFVSSLPLAGTSGSLKSFGNDTPLTGKFTAKSGYMARVMNYAGYLTTQSGSELVVVVLVNNYSCPNAEMKALLERVISGFAY